MSFVSDRVDASSRTHTRNDMLTDRSKSRHSSLPFSQLIPSLPSWLSSSGPSTPTSGLSEKMMISNDQSGRDDSTDEDAPPQFPLPDSAQRSRAKTTTTTTMDPPLPTFEIDEPEPDEDEDEDDGPPTPRANPRSLPSTTPTLPLPPTTTTRPNPAIKKRQKVALAPGCSPLDWAKLKSSGKDLRGTGGATAGNFGYMRVTMDELKKHNKTGDAWSVFNGKVYNMSEYARFHPGGEKELMRVAGRDGTRLFSESARCTEVFGSRRWTRRLIDSYRWVSSSRDTAVLTHAWVNVDFMLDNCMIGFLVPG